MANNDLAKKKPVALEVATYERLSKLAAQLRIDNPGGGFVSMSTAVGVLLDGWEKLNKIKVIPFSPDMELSEFVKTAVRSAVDNIADAESNEQVVIKDGSCRYMTESTMAGANFFLTDHKEKAMVFDNRDQAAAFLRKCGHEVGNWILEPA